jgi:hypothetical protein
VRQIKPEQVNNFQEKFLKLIPTEFVAGWVGFVTVMALSENLIAKKWITLIASILLFVALPYYLMKRLKIECKNHITASMIAFVAWVYIMPGGPATLWGVYLPEIALAVGLLTGIGLPAIYQQENGGNNEK